MELFLKFSKFFSIFLVIFSLIFRTSPAVFAEEAGEEIHYLAFTSDIHGKYDILETALTGLPETEYVSLIGDMVGEGGGSQPTFLSSTLLDHVKTALSSQSALNTSIIWADHDTNVDDDAGIVKESGGRTSGEIYEGKDSSGNTIYYIYAIGFYDMTTGGSTSQTAAENFKSWIKDLGPSIPVIVLCHVPLVAKRGDNNGAPYWNEALNFAATGVEGITDTSTSADLIRNVFYFYGHNHTVDKTEYYFAPGETMNVQIDTTAPTDGLLYTTLESTDEELGAVTAKGTESNVFYNALITGYIKTSGNSTLMSISSDTITLEKFNSGSPISLGTDGSTGEILASSVTIARIPAEEAEDDETPLAPDTSRVASNDFASASLISTTLLALLFGLLLSSRTFVL